MWRRELLCGSIHSQRVLPRLVRVARRSAEFEKVEIVTRRIRPVQHHPHPPQPLNIDLFTQNLLTVIMPTSEERAAQKARLQADIERA